MGPRQRRPQPRAHSKNIPYKIIPGEAAFYGPKIDIKLVDVLGRLWQLSTVQFDFNLPERFELEYVGEDGEPHQPVMVHRALFGSVERFFGVLIEHYAGAFPLLARARAGRPRPHQRKAPRLRRESKAAPRSRRPPRRARPRNEKMNAKIRDFGLQKVPYILVFGDKEMQTDSVSVRVRGKGDQGSTTVTDFLTRATKLVTHHSMEL